MDGLQWKPPLKMDDLGAPLFRKPPDINIHHPIYLGIPGCFRFFPPASLPVSPRYWTSEESQPWLNEARLAQEVMLGPGSQGPVGTTCQWEFQEPKLKVPTIHKAYVRAM